MMTETRPDPSTQPIELSIGGMTCASCVARVERKLNKLEGVVATVNFATEKARVIFPARLSTVDLVKVVRGNGLHRHAAPAGRVR